MMRARNLAAVLVVLAMLPELATAQTATQGSANCAVITQASAAAIAAQISADQTVLTQPASVTSLSCLNNFFNGVGLNVVTNLLNPTALLNSIVGQLCNAAKQAFQSATGSVMCGLTVTGFNFGMGFGGLGGGLTCPKLNFGGGGPPLAGFGIGAGAPAGTGLPPSGYTISQQVNLGGF